MNVHVISVEGYEDIFMLRGCIAGSYGSSVFFIYMGEKVIS